MTSELRVERVIFKYPIELDGGVSTIQLPWGSRILTMQLDAATEKPTVWVEQYRSGWPLDETVNFQIVVTGGAVPEEWKYLGTFQVSDSPLGNFVGHVYIRWGRT